MVQVADSADIDKASVFRMEKGAQWVAPETLEAIAAFLGVSPAAFFTDEVVKIEPTPQEALEIISAALSDKESESLSAEKKSLIDRVRTLDKHETAFLSDTLQTHLSTKDLGPSDSIQMSKGELKANRKRPKSKQIG